MAKTNTANLKPRNPARPPWHLHGKESFIAKLREVDRLTFDEIGFRVGCSGEGARQAYVRHLKKDLPPASDKDAGEMSARTAGTERGKDTPPEAEGRGKQVEAE